MNNILSEKFYEQYVMMYEWVNLYLNALSERDIKQELSPGKNHGVWILGHLIVSDDDFSLYMDKGDLLFPEYREIFAQGSKLLKPEQYPADSLMREQWKQVIKKNKIIYESLNDNEFNEESKNPSRDPENPLRLKDG